MASDEQGNTGQVNVLEDFYNHIDGLAKFLEAGAEDLERFSALRVSMDVPDPVREYLIERHGERLRWVLERLDTAPHRVSPFVLKGSGRRRSDPPPT